MYVNKIDSNGDGTVDSTISYEYDTDGVRVAKDENGQVLFYLADKENFTGYAQTIEERDGSGDLVKSYTIGLDVLSEYDAVAAVVHYLMTDWHGSVRGLTHALGAIISGQRFGFDAYGNAPMASCFSTFKVEKVYHEKHETHEHAVDVASEYIGHGYNPKRLRSALMGGSKEIDSRCFVQKEAWNHCDLFVGYSANDEAKPRALVASYRPAGKTAIAPSRM